MKLITIDGKEYNIKYRQNKETVSFDVNSAAYNYPDFVGSKIYHNSSSSDKYSINFGIHKSQFVALKESLKKYLINESNAVIHPTYGALTNIIIEHPLYGAVFGKIVGSVSFDTSSEADIIGSFTFQVHTLDNPKQKKDINVENSNALNAIDAETTSNFDVNLSVKDKSALSRFATKLSNLYIGIQNSSVVSAFNDFNAELNATILDSQRIMNAVKNILSLPNTIFTNTRSKLDLLQKQANAIKDIPVTSYNLALFNANAMSYNMGITTRTAFVSSAAQQAAAGLKVVPLT